MHIHRAVLQQIANNATYDFCIFDSENPHRLKNCCFWNCSFRGDVSFQRLENCQFRSCYFSGKFKLSLSGPSYESKDNTLQRLRSIPDYVFLLSALSALDLSYHFISEIPQDICKLKNLTHLQLHDNSLKCIPDELSTLTNLSELDVSNNDLRALPQTLGSLQNLQLLNVCNNKITDIPRSITQLPNLKLVIRDNPITAQQKEKIISYKPLCNIEF